MSYDATESLLQAERSLMNLSNWAKNWIEFSQATDQFLSVLDDSGFVLTRSTDDEVQDSQPPNRQQYSAFGQDDCGSFN
jgi:hypothetical protein